MSKIQLWDWTTSHGKLPDSMVRAAYYAITNNGATSEFSYIVWNEIVDYIKTIVDESGKTWYSGTGFLTYSQTRMYNSKVSEEYDDKVLTAKRFNTLMRQLDWHYWSWWLDKSHIGYIPDARYFRGSSDSKIPDKVYGKYFIELLEIANIYAIIINGDAKLLKASHATTEDQYGRLEVKGDTTFAYLSSLNTESVRITKANLKINQDFTDTHLRARLFIKPKNYGHLSTTNVLHMPTLESMLVKVNVDKSNILITGNPYLSAHDDIRLISEIGANLTTMNYTFKHLTSTNNIPFVFYDYPGTLKVSDTKHVTGQTKEKLDIRFYADLSHPSPKFIYADEEERIRFVQSNPHLDATNEKRLTSSDAMLFNNYAKSHTLDVKHASPLDDGVINLYTSTPKGKALTIRHMSPLDDGVINLPTSQPHGKTLQIVHAKALNEERIVFGNSNPKCKALWIKNLGKGKCAFSVINNNPPLKQCEANNKFHANEVFDVVDEKAYVVTRPALRLPSSSYTFTITGEAKNLKLKDPLHIPSTYCNVLSDTEFAGIKTLDTAKLAAEPSNIVFSHSGHLTLKFGSKFVLLTAETPITADYTLARVEVINLKTVELKALNVTKVITGATLQSTVPPRLKAVVNVVSSSEAHLELFNKFINLTAGDEILVKNVKVNAKLLDTPYLKNVDDGVSVDNAAHMISYDKYNAFLTSTSNSVNVNTSSNLNTNTELLRLTSNDDEIIEIGANMTTIGLESVYYGPVTKSVCEEKSADALNEMTATTKSAAELLADGLQYTFPAEKVPVFAVPLTSAVTIDFIWSSSTEFPMESFNYEAGGYKFFCNSDDSEEPTRILEPTLIGAVFKSK